MERLKLNSVPVASSVKASTPAAPGAPKHSLVEVLENDVLVLGSKPLVFNKAEILFCPLETKHLY